MQEIWKPTRILPYAEKPRCEQTQDVLGKRSGQRWGELSRCCSNLVHDACIILPCERGKAGASGHEARCVVGLCWRTHNQRLEISNESPFLMNSKSGSCQFEREVGISDDQHTARRHDSVRLGGCNMQPTQRSRVAACAAFCGTWTNSLVYVMANVSEGVLNVLSC